MRNSALTSARTAAALPTDELERVAQGWLLDCEIRQHSTATLALRKIVLSKLSWFLHERKLNSCGTLELRQFLAYLTRAHDEPGGRWGNAQQTRPVKPGTVATYHRHLRTFFRWIVVEGVLDDSPMESVSAPIARPDQVQPFTPEQVSTLLAAAKKSQHARRDQALLLFLLDTGVRASELCSVITTDLDMQGRCCTVMGKGRKKRTVSFGGTTAKALWQYLREDPRDPGDPLFYSERGAEPLTRSGLRQLFERLGKAAGITATRCSPHTLRHTFAVEFLRAGGNVFTLQQMLGHTSITMTQRYVAFAQADIAAQHRQFSPADRLRIKRK